jgi:hypothetical protein
VSHRQSVLVLVALSVAAFATAFVLVHGVGHQALQGSRTDPADPDAPAEATRVKVECASAASGPRLNGEGTKTDVGDLAEADDVAEDDGFTLEQEGLDVAEVSDACGRVRTERLAHAGELGVLGVLLAAWATLRRRSGPLEPVEPVAPVVPAKSQRRLP